MPHFLHWTLQKAGAVSKAVVGSFTGPKQNEVVAARGKVLALYRISESGRVQTVYENEAFGLIRNIASLRLTGGVKDYLAVTSDSGRIAILDWDSTQHKFVKLHQETYGKTGIRRVVAGEFLAVDPKGRALIIGALEKQKFVYILNRDVSGRMQIGSPLEAHKSHQICFDICALDVGYENPVFISLEISYEAVDSYNPQPANPFLGAVHSTKKSSGQFKQPSKHLAFWEMDLGLNHVVKKCTLTCDPSATAIIPIPAGTEFSEGPGGVLVCCENFIQFKKPDHADVIVALPRRLETDQNKGIMITAWTTHKMKEFYFVLLQSELGDLYRLEIINEGPTVKELICRYLDTVPPATSLCVLKSGFLFVALEMGDHQVYQFMGIGNDETRYVCSSQHPDGRKAQVLFKPRKLKNLLAASSLPSLAPLTDMKVIDCMGDSHTPQIYSLCGAGPRSHLSILRQGLTVEEMAASEVPGFPTGLWTVRERFDDAHHSYILLSFASVTLVLKVTDSIEEQTSTQFLTDRATLHADCLADNSHVQITEEGWRLLQLLDDGADQRRINEWKAPAGKRVVCAASTPGQLIIALTGGFLCYFELQIGSNLGLMEVGSIDLGLEVTCLALQPIGTSSLMSTFVAVGGNDRSVRTLCLEKDKVLFRQISLYSVDKDSHAESIALCKLPFSHTETDTDGLRNFGTVLFVGLSTGVLTRFQVDTVTGQLSTYKRQKFLGGAAVHIVPVIVRTPVETDQGGDVREDSKNLLQTCVCLSSKPWLAYAHKGQFRLTPLLFDQIDVIASLNSVHCSHGFVAICGNVLKIIAVTIDPQDQFFNEVRVPLEYTPRKATVFPPPPSQAERQDAQLKGMPIMLLPPSAQRPWYIAEIESDHNAFDMATKRKIAEGLADVDLKQIHAVNDGAAPNGETIETSADPSNTETSASEGSNAPSEESQTDNNTSIVNAEEDEDETDDALKGSFKAGEGKWGGCLRLINPSPPQIVQTVPFGSDEAPTCLAVCQFLEYSEHPSLVVGTVTGLNLRTKRCLRGSLKVYVYNAEGVLELYHETPLEDVPLALCAWSGRLLASVGNRIRIYTLGRKRLLKRCEYKNLPVGVNWLRVSGPRIFAADIREGFHVLKYLPMDNAFSVVADMTVPRWITCGEILDPYSLIGGDKFDNLFVVRMPLAAISDVDEVDLSALKVRGDTSYLTGQTHKFERVCEFHVGDMPTAVQKCLLAPGCSEVIIFGSILGGIGVMLPLQTQKEVEMLQHLEMLMRNEDISLVGRDHTFFRSAYFPVRNVIDGDLLRIFPRLPPERQTWVAQQIDKTPGDILRVLDEIRSRII